MREINIFSVSYNISNLPAFKEVDKLVIFFIQKAQSFFSELRFLVFILRNSVLAQLFAKYQDRRGHQYIQLFFS